MKKKTEKKPKIAPLFQDWVRKQSLSVDEYALAKKAIREVPELLIPPVAERISNIRRMATLEKEVEAFREHVSSLNPNKPADTLSVGANRNIVSAPVDKKPDIGALKAILAETFSVSQNGIRVTWGQATVDQHKERIRMLQGQIFGTQATIRRHEIAIEVLEQSDADCLDDISA
jgi:hypothetical protein